MDRDHAGSEHDMNAASACRVIGGVLVALIGVALALGGIQLGRGGAAAWPDVVASEGMVKSVAIGMVILAVPTLVRWRSGDRETLLGRLGRGDRHGTRGGRGLLGERRALRAHPPDPHRHEPGHGCDDLGIAVVWVQPPVRERRSSSPDQVQSFRTELADTAAT
jgi:hypothetical protein